MLGQTLEASGRFPPPRGAAGAGGDDAPRIHQKWKPVALTERAAAQTHFNDLCAAPWPNDDPVTADPTGDSFTFEKGATKTGGGDGFADVWKRGHFRLGVQEEAPQLADALTQLLRYAAALENPPLHVACDTDRFTIVAAWTNTVSRRWEIALEELEDPQKLAILHAVFHDPEKLRPERTRQGLTREAADKFSTIALNLEGTAPPEHIAHFVNQLVFCFFASAVRLLPEGFFPRLLKKAAQRPQRARHYLDQLFAAMERGGEFDLTDIAHFNGGLFDGRRALPLDATSLGILVAVSSLEWDAIDPTIFGTLFERFLDPDKRAQIGAHYTDPAKIMLIIEPVVLRPLEREWALAKARSRRWWRRRKPMARARSCGRRPRSGAFSSWSGCAPCAFSIPPAARATSSISRSRV